MSKKRKDRLLLNLLEGEKHKHRVAMVNEEAEWNQHEPNSNMARMFVVMLLIHVVVIGGIIVYDWLNGEETQPNTVLVEASSTSTSTLPAASVSTAAIESVSPIEDCATYEWRSGDSIASVAAKLGVSQEVLIKMNMLDKGTQLEANSIIRYPKQPVVKAVGISVAGTDGEQGVPSVASLASTGANIPLTAPGEKTFSFQPTIENELAATPGTTPVVMPVVQDTPPASMTQGAVGEPAVIEAKKEVPLVNEESPPATPVKEEKVVIKSESKAEPTVPKAIPIKRYAPPVIEKPASKKNAETTASKAAPAKTTRSTTSYTVKPNETLYSIATRHGVTVKALQSANKITKPENLRDGMTLVIPAR